jgi:hypothetical protein
MLDANELERIAKERPDECFLKGSGVLKLIGGIRQLESELRALRACGERPRRLSDPESQPDVQRLLEEITSSKEAAITFLKRGGFLTAEGRLAPQYGGDDVGDMAGHLQAREGASQ